MLSAEVQKLFCAIIFTSVHVKDDLTPDDIDDLMVAMRAKAERNKKKKSGV